MSNIPNQKPVWDKKHAAGDHEQLRHQPSPLAKLTKEHLETSSDILELGCGVGRDAEFFADLGHNVIATDASEVVITQNKQLFVNSPIKFAVLDMLEDLPYPDTSFDLVFANLSLHYYSDLDTKRIIKEIKRVLRPAGILAFACKSIKDEHHGNGTEVEKDIFVSANGHVRHLFSEEYAKELLEELFEIKHLDVVSETYNSQESSILRCIAKNIPEAEMGKA